MQATHNTMNVPSNTLSSLIEQRLQNGFTPTKLNIVDESHLHSGHAGAEGGGQHFNVTMRSRAFAQLNRVQRHQLVYTCLHDLMQNPPPHGHAHLGYIHALKLQLDV